MRDVKHQIQVGNIMISHLATRDVMQLHGDPVNRFAMFQVTLHNLIFNTEL